MTNPAAMPPSAEAFPVWSSRQSLEWVAVACLLAVHATLAWTATLGMGPTFDEPAHIASGLSYWRFNDYRLQPENGNLPQRWCALPLLFMDVTFPQLEGNQPWAHSVAPNVGRQLLYLSGNDPAAILAASRAMAVIWSTGLCLVVFLWSRSLWGVGGGMLSLVLAAFWPAFLAHGPLATSDCCGAMFFTLAVWVLWQLLARLTWTSLLAAGLVTGLAAIAKHSAILLGPIYLLLLVGRLVIRRPWPISLGGLQRPVTGRGQQLALGLGLAGFLAVATTGVIWAAVGFRYEAMALGLEPMQWPLYDTFEGCAEEGGLLGKLALAAASVPLLPEAWLFGLSWIGSHSHGRYAFALGHYAKHGWWWYFPLCFAIKNTVAGIVLACSGLVASLSASCRRGLAQPVVAARGGAILPLLVSLAVLWLTFLTSNLNIGERHLMASYPPLLILAGSLWKIGYSHSWLRWLVGILAALHAAEATSRYPFFLSSFNPVVRPGEEYLWLADSNLDWGQDTPRLAAWLNDHQLPGEPVYLGAFGAGLPTAYLPDHESLGSAPAAGQPQQLEPGLYCLHATYLQAVYSRPQGRWCRTFESSYQQARAYVSTAAQPPADSLQDFARKNLQLDDELADSPHERAVYAFNLLQAGRLRAYLRHRPADASIGGSILIYRLSAADLAAALTGPPAELDEISWMQREAGGSAAELLARGTRLMEEGQLEEAIEVLTTAISLNDLSPLAYYNRGNAFAATKQLERAAADYTAAIARDPTSKDPYFNRGVMLLRQGKPQQAVADFRKYVALGGKLPQQVSELLDQAGLTVSP